MTTTPALVAQGSNSDDDDGLSTPIVAAIIAAVVVIALLVLAVVYKSNQGKASEPSAFDSRAAVDNPMYDANTATSDGYMDVNAPETFEE